MCRLAEGHVRTLPGVATSSFIGVIPAIIHVRNATVVIKCRYALFRPVVHHVPDSTNEERTRAAFCDLLGMLKGLVQNGIVLRVSLEPAQPEPDMGMLTRCRKTWKWQKVPWQWDAFDGLTKPPNAPGLSTLRPKQLLTLLETTYVDIWCGAVTLVDELTTHLDPLTDSPETTYKASAVLTSFTPSYTSNDCPATRVHNRAIALPTSSHLTLILILLS